MVLILCERAKEDKVLIFRREEYGPSLTRWLEALDGTAAGNVSVELLEHPREARQHSHRQPRVVVAADDIWDEPVADVCEVFRRLWPGADVLQLPEGHFQQEHDQHLDPIALLGAFDRRDVILVSPHDRKCCERVLGRHGLRLVRQVQQPSLAKVQRAVQKSGVRDVLTHAVLPKDVETFLSENGCNVVALPNSLRVSNWLLDRAPAA